MKILRSLAVMLPLFAFGLGTVEQESLTDSGDISRFDGSYLGAVESNGVMVPVLTRLDSRGRSYYYMNEGERLVKGSLIECRASSAARLWCDWQDEYGRGVLKLVFDQNMDSFSGEWTTPGDDNRYKWNGVKMREGLE